MAVSQVGMADWGNIKSFQGLSTDDKPVSNTTGNVKYIIGSGSKFYELDTGKTFVYDENNVNVATTNGWWEIVVPA